jgi:probable phosphoglycerate mutase
MDLVLVRHAEPVRLTSEDTGGAAADPGLTARGHDQARRLAEWLAPEHFDVLLVSPKRRALETAAPIAAVLDLAIVIDESIVEYDAEADHYIPMEELRASNDPRLLAMYEGRWDEFGAEQPEVFRARLHAALDTIVGEHAGQRVLAICHGGVINVLLAIILDLERHLWFDPAYTSVSRVIASRGGVRSIASVNESGHLVGMREIS